MSRYDHKIETSLEEIKKIANDNQIITCKKEEKTVR